MCAAAGFCWWLVLLAASWGCPVAQAEWQEDAWPEHAQGYAWPEHAQGYYLPSRHLLAADLTTEDAEEALRDVGIDDFGPILFMRRGGDCPLDSLSENDTETVNGYCTAIERMRRCRGRENLDPKSSRPLFDMDCMNGSCVDTLSISATACNLNGRVGIPLQETVNRSCELAVPETNNSAVPHVPFFITENGKEPIFDCLFGWPRGTQILVKYICIEGFFRMEVTTILGGEPLVPDNAAFRCIRDTRCDGLGSEEGLRFEGDFICYLPNGSTVALTSAVGDRGFQVLLLLVACMLALLFSVV